jgi:hypothetical protein
MEVRELAPGYHIPKMPMGKTIGLMVLTGFITLFWLGAIAVLVFGGATGLGIMEAGDQPMPSPVVTIGGSVAGALALFLVGCIPNWLAGKVASPYWPVRISDLANDA